MKKFYNYIMLFAMALVAVSCSDEEPVAQNTAKAGDEVQFGLSLDPLSRTVYGAEADNVFPIYWVNGDKVQVYSPQCLEGRRSAEYQVAVTSTNQNYADNLTKTGAYGVQWGDAEHATFYSLYPSGSYTVSGDGAKAENITINYTQTIKVENDGTIHSDMEDCLMYAKTENVKKEDGVVDLHYDPITTVLWITLSAENNDFTIQSISLIASENIAGTFSLNLSDGAFGEFAEDKASRTITTQIVNKATGGFHSLKNGESISLPLFLAPATYSSVADWKVQVVANNNTYTKTLDIEQELKPGMIHKITLPKLKPETTEWNVSNWMKNIPRNVYLSEVSIPGSWNSINSNFQKVDSNDEKTIANQYHTGVRAFHLDTRWKANYDGGLLGFWETVTVVGLGVADGGSTGGENSSTVNIDGNKYMRGDDTPLVKDVISQLVGYIKSTPQEYMVLVCSFAQASINHKGSNGYWYDEISAICNNSNYTDYIVDASKLTPNTVVGDVLGKILVIVNMQSEITSESDLPDNSKCLFTYMPSELTAARFSATDNATLLRNNTDNLWYSGSTVATTGMTIYNNQAQITSSTGSAITNHNRGYVPSIDGRTNVLNTIVDWSKSNYGTANYNHDKWIYLGLGGYQVNSGGNASEVNGSYSTIANTYNSWINQKVTEMGTEVETAVVPYYPVGIVLMNHVETYSETVKNILLLNNKYRLQYDPTKPADYNPNSTGDGDGANNGEQDEV